MTSAKSRRVPLWKLAGAVLAAIALLAGALWVWVESVVEWKWAKLEKRAAGWVEEAKGRDARRPVLRGEALPWNAWEDYSAAIGQVELLRIDNDLLDEFLAGEMKALKAVEVEAMLSLASGALERWRAGTRRDLAQYPWGWNEGRIIRGFPDSAFRSLAYLALSKARVLADVERTREAAEWALDVLQFGRDLRHNGYLDVEGLASHVERRALEELRRCVVSGNASKEDLLEIETQLGVLERAFPDHATLHLNQRIRDARRTLSGEDCPRPTVRFRLVRTWRHAFSLRLMRLQACEVLLQRDERMARCGDGPWADEARVLEEIRGEIEDLKNPMLEDVEVEGSREARGILAVVRLLRMAARFRATGGLPDLDDPFGGRLSHAVEGGRARFWSRGRDGNDDGGTAVKDIVLEVTR